jgi:hypothetical protein
MIEPVYGNHIGIVINSNPDPEGRGRVQIFVPHLSTTLYQGWNQDAKDVTLTQGSLAGISTNILQRLQQNLPWAECAFPLFGTGGTTYGDVSTKETRPSNSSVIAVEERTSPGHTSDLNQKSGPTIPGVSDSSVLSSGSSSTSQSLQSPINNVSIDDLTPNEVLYAMRISATETGAGIGSGSDIANKNYAETQASDFKTNLLNSFLNNKATPGAINADGSLNLEVIQSKYLKVIDISYSQSNLTNVEEYNLPYLNNGSYQDQIFSVAYLIRKRYPSAVSLINSKDFNTADSIISPFYHGLKNQPKSAKLLETNIKNQFNGDVLAALQNINSSLAPTKPFAQWWTDNGGTYQTAGVDTNKQTNPSYNPKQNTLDSTTPLPGIDMRHPNGMNSTPLAGTFVWCFFLGGDIQKPVYFAGVKEKFANARTSTIPSPV